MPLPTLAPWPRAGSVDDVTSHVPIIPTPSGRKPTPIKLPAQTSHHSGQSSPQTHGISTVPSSLGFFRDSHDSSRRPLSDQPHYLSNTENTGDGPLFSPVHGMCAAHNNNRDTVLASYVYSEELGFETVRRIDEMAEVAQPVISPSGTHHTSVLGARTSESKSGGVA